ncbi:hypothetical protein DI273_01115 [Streptomyces violascens]|nr:hypothetical protein DI273_01115 [Streptomyces violascens]
MQRLWCAGRSAQQVHGWVLRRCGTRRPLVVWRLLTDARWTRIEPPLPDRTPHRGGRRRDHRQVIYAIAWKEVRRP